MTVVHPRNIKCYEFFTWFGEELMNKRWIKKYSYSIIKWRWPLMSDYFNHVRAMFLGLGSFQLCCFLCRDRTLKCYIINMNLGSEDKIRSYGFRTTWGLVINNVHFWGKLSSLRKSIYERLYVTSYQAFWTYKWIAQIKLCHFEYSLHMKIL